VPHDLGDALDVDAARLLSRDLMAKFGELLEAWPALVEATRQLRARGYRVSDSCN
jgi:FMN phosphatase YigB (HAD superfamily)